MKIFSLPIGLILGFFSIPEISFANMVQLADRAYQNGAPLVALMALRDEMTYTPGPCHGPINQISGMIESETIEAARKAKAAAWLDIRKEPLVLSFVTPTSSPIEIRAIDVTGKTIYSGLTPENTVTEPVTFSQKMTKASWIFLQIESQDTEQGPKNWRQWLQTIILLPESQFRRYQSIPFRRVQLVRAVPKPASFLQPDGLKFFTALNQALYENPGLTTEWAEFAKIGVQSSPALGLVALEPEIKNILHNTPARNPHVNGTWNRQGECW